MRSVNLNFVQVLVIGAQASREEEKEKEKKRGGEGGGDKEELLASHNNGITVNSICFFWDIKLFINRTGVTYFLVFEVKIFVGI